MPKYYNYMICGYFLYFTSHCIIEAMHVHASKHHLKEQGSAKFFVKNNGETIVQKTGMLTTKEIESIQKFIKTNYEEMYLLWQRFSKNSYYND